MHAEHPSRRAFLASSTSALGGAWLLGLEPLVEAARAHALGALRAQSAFETLTAREAADFDAFAARILPSDDGTPGAREAGAVYFADRALGTFMADLLPIVQGGLADLARRASPSAFAELAPVRQDEILREVEADPASPFFFMGRTLVMLGTFGDPSRGGNRDRVGWSMIGFDPQPAHEPPFGYYDAGPNGPGR